MCARIEAVTAGSVSTANTLTEPPQRGQTLMSMSYTRVSRGIEVIAVRETRASGSSSALGAHARGFVTSCARTRASGANTPWYLMRCTRGRGNQHMQVKVQVQR